MVKNKDGGRALNGITFSVVVPLYNKMRYIEKTVQSVLKQTFQDFEIIIVDDGSKDDSYKVVCDIAKENKKVKVIKQENTGVAVARNTGIENAVGDYIAFLDADDLWKENYLETIYSLINKYTQSDIFVTAYDIFFSDNKINHSTVKCPDDGIEKSYWKTFANTYDFVWTSATTIRRQALIEAGMFTPGEKIGQDLDMWARVACNNPLVAWSSKSCVIYNRSADENARTRVKVAYPKAFLTVLEKEMKNSRWSEEERYWMGKKYDKKMIVYVFTTIMAGKRKEARTILKKWSMERHYQLIPILFVASFLPNFINKFAYKIRLKVF